MPSDRDQLDAAKRMIEQTRKDRDDLASQIRSSKETIAKAQETLARIDRLLADLEGKKP
jgi:septal ring factor EnvC (AmiA/AmiB activator)